MRRRQRAVVLRTVTILTTIAILLTVVDVLHVSSILQSHTSTPDWPAPRPRIFIASIHWNTEIILRASWSAAVLSLAQAIGPDNVFVSIVESGSYDKSKEALQDLQKDLDGAGIPNNFLFDSSTHQDELAKGPRQQHKSLVHRRPGWIRTPSGKMGMRRIPYLSKWRNKALEPLYSPRQSRYDKIIFLNDVVFNLDDIKTLLATNNGEYTAACSLDFKYPPYFYDTFALRDSAGHEAMQRTWPFFRAGPSRKAMAAHLPVPVSSCWNGIVVMDSTPFYAKKPLVFRGVTDSLAVSHVEGSESCLVHADAAVVAPEAAGKGVWMNPNVRVAYSTAAYAVVSKKDWLSPAQIAVGSWENRIRRWTTTVWVKERVIRRRLNAWMRQTQHRPRKQEYQDFQDAGDEEEPRIEPGWFCLVNEMQLVAKNGWWHA